MNAALVSLDKIESELARLLMTGLSTQRGGRQEIAALAEEAAALKLERLAAELRRLGGEGDPATLTASALTALAMCRKLGERLIPWPEVDPETGIPLDESGLVRSSEATAPPGDDVAELAQVLASDDGLRRAQAARRLVALGEAALPGLARLARKGSPAVRRDAVAALGDLGGHAALETLMDLLEGGEETPDVLRALLPHGQASVPSLVAIASAALGKKKEEGRRRAAVAALYRLGAFRELLALPVPKDDDPTVAGLTVAARARLNGGWEEPGTGLPSAPWQRWDVQPLSTATVRLAEAEATGNIGLAVEALDSVPVNQLRLVVSHAVCAGPLEDPLREHYLRRLSADRAKDRKVAAAVLRSLASSADVAPVAAMLRAGELDVDLATDVLGAAGGDHATGVLLDLAYGENIIACVRSLEALTKLGDPGTVPGLIGLLSGAAAASAGAEAALVAMGDGAVDRLGETLAGEPESAVAAKIQSILLQIKTPRAKAALQGKQADSLDALFGRLEHTRLGPEAAKAIARNGEDTLARLQPLLTGPNHTARRNALAAVVALKGERSREVLRELVSEMLGRAPNLADWDLTERAVKALAARRDGDARTRDLLLRAVSCRIEGTSLAAADGLAALGRDLAPALMPLLDHPEPQARAGALRALGKMGALEAEPKACELLNDSRMEVCRAAAQALVDLVDAGANPRLLDLLGEAMLQDKNYFTSYAAFEAMERSNRREAIPWLRKYVKKHAYFSPRADKAVARIEATAPPLTEEPKGGFLGRLRNLLGSN